LLGVKLEVILLGCSQDIVEKAIKLAKSILSDLRIRIERESYRKLSLNVVPYRIEDGIPTARVEDIKEVIPKIIGKDKDLTIYVFIFPRFIIEKIGLEGEVFYGPVCGLASGYSFSRKDLRVAENHYVFISGFFNDPIKIAHLLIHEAGELLAIGVNHCHKNCVFSGAGCPPYVGVRRCLNCKDLLMLNPCPAHRAYLRLMSLIREFLVRIGRLMGKEGMGWFYIPKLVYNFKEALWKIIYPKAGIDAIGDKIRKFYYNLKARLYRMGIFWF